MYYLENREYRIKHFDEDKAVKQKICDFIKQQTAKGCTNFCVKRSTTPMVSSNNTPGVMPYLNVSDAEQFNNLKGEDVTIEFENYQ